jgi:hypothetical protein
VRHRQGHILDQRHSRESPAGCSGDETGGAAASGRRKPPAAAARATTASAHAATAEPKKAGQAKDKPSQAKPSQAKPGQAKSSTGGCSGDETGERQPVAGESRQWRQPAQLPPRRSRNNGGVKAGQAKDKPGQAPADADRARETTRQPHGSRMAATRQPRGGRATATWQPQDGRMATAGQPLGSRRQSHGSHQAATWPQSHAQPATAPDPAPAPARGPAPPRERAARGMAQKGTRPHARATLCPSRSAQCVVRYAAVVAPRPICIAWASRGHLVGSTSRGQRVGIAWASRGHRVGIAWASRGHRAGIAWPLRSPVGDSPMCPPCTHQAYIW